MDLSEGLRNDLGMDAWITPTSMREVAGEDTREWDLLIRLWGTGNEVTTVGPFATWGAALEWAVGPVCEERCTVLGIAEHRRPRRGWVADRPRKRRAGG